MIYSKDVIEKLNEWLVTKTAEPHNYLVEQKKTELIKMAEAVLASNSSFEWLLQNKFLTLAAFVKAVEGESKSLQFLIKNKAVHWAATANAINYDRSADAFLRKNKLSHYAELAKILREIFEELENKNAFGKMHNPFT